MRTGSSCNIYSQVFEGFTNQELGQEACVVNGRHAASFLRPETIVILQIVQQLDIFLARDLIVLNTSNKKKAAPKILECTHIKTIGAPSQRI